MKSNFLVQKFTLLIIITLANLSGLVFANDLPSGDIPSDEVRFAVVGDTGTGGTRQNAIAQQMLKLQSQSNFDLVLFMGDNIYPSGSPKDFEKKFLKPYQEFIEKGIELRACIGNHDARNQYGILLQKMVFGMGAKTYYSFSRKDDLIEFFALDSTILVKDNKIAERDEQIKWFENSLAKSRAKWKVVFLHHPLYSSAKRHGLGSDDEDKMMNMKDLIEPLMQKYGVNLVVNGHDHVYERTKPQGRIHYFTSGAGGRLRKNNLDKDSPFFAFGNDEVNSFMLFSANPDLVQFWTVDIEGNVIDNGKILK